MMLGGLSLMDTIKNLPWLTEAVLLLGLLNVLLFGIGVAYVIAIHRKLKRYRFLSKSGNDKQLEELLLDMFNKFQVLDQNMNQMEEHFVKSLVDQEKHFQHCGLIRFQAFQNTGGDQSFALALLDAHGDGFVLSSLFGRDESRVYCKPVEAGKSKYALSKEEQNAIEMAMGHPIK